jgi:ABC-type uncharacterized transport system fused permease/ATPase subunit
MYELIVESLPRVALITVSHHRAIDCFHANVFDMHEQQTSHAAHAPSVQSHNVVELF